MSECRPHPRGALTLFALLLLLFSLFAADQFIPQRIKSADFYLYDTYLVGTTFGSVSDLQLNSSIPADGVLTSVPPGASTALDADGNSYLYINMPNPSMPYNFTYNLSVHTQFQPLTALGGDTRIPRSFGRYLISTPGMPASDPAMKELASNITAGARTDFERIALLAEWVHDYITYDASASNPNPNTATILETRRGVCTEYSVLFVTLARSLGYPARFVNGYAYASTLNVWQAHSWAEVWIGEWVPVDPTWLEVGSIDATHIVVSRSSYSEFNLVSVSGLVQEPGQIILNGNRPLGSRADNVNLVSAESMPPQSGYSLSSSSSTLPGAGHALVWVSYTAPDYSVISMELAPCSSTGSPLITLASPARQRFITAPGQTYYGIWLVQAAAQIDPHFIYRCPLTLNSDSLSLKTAIISLRDDVGSSWPIISAEVERNYLLLGEKQTVFVHLPASMAGETVHLLAPEFNLNASVNGAGAAKFEFVPTEPGVHTLYAFSSRGDPVALSYSVLTVPAPTIASASANQSLIEGETSELIVELADLDAGTAARPFTLAWSGNGESGQENVESGPSQTLRIPIRPSMSGEFVFIWSLVSADGTEIARRTMPVKIWPAGDVVFDSLQPRSRVNSGWQVALQFNISGEVRHPQLLLGGTLWEIPSDGNLVVIVGSGSQPASVRWQDVLGVVHSRSFMLEFSPVAATPLFAPAPKSPLAGLYDPNQNVLLPGLLVFIFFGVLFGGALYSHLYELRMLYRSDSEVGKEGGPGPDDAVPPASKSGGAGQAKPELPKPDLRRRRPPTAPGGPGA